MVKKAKKRGRPKGSKNKVKVAALPMKKAKKKKATTSAATKTQGKKGRPPGAKNRANIKALTAPTPEFVEPQIPAKVENRNSDGKVSVEILQANGQPMIISGKVNDVMAIVQATINS